jgi:hypothetical protein
MSKAVFIICLLALAGAAQSPTRLFEVRSGGSTQTSIVFRDAAGKEVVIDAFARLGNYQDTIGGRPNPQTKEQFFNSELQQFIRDRVAAARHQIAAENAHKGVDESDLPPRPGAAPTPTPAPVPTLLTPRVRRTP